MTSTGVLMFHLSFLTSITSKNMLIFSAGYEEVYGWRSSIKRNRKALNMKRPTRAKWEDSKTPPKTEEATPRNAQQKMHNAHYKRDATNHLDHRARRHTDTLRRLYIPQPLGPIKTLTSPHRTEVTRKRQKREVLDAFLFLSSGDENTDYNWRIPGHIISFSSLQNKNTHYFLICLMRSDRAYGSCTEVCRSYQSVIVHSYFHTGVFSKY